MTRHDFYRLAVERLLPSDVPNYWEAYRAGRMTHFEALQAYFAAIRADEAAVNAVIAAMEPDPDMADEVGRLRAAGWDVVVASAGCEWYIHRLLRELVGRVEIHANPGEFVPGRGLLMRPAAESPFYSPTHGIDKAAIVRSALRSGRLVAYAGDGYPDREPALLVPAERRFARGDLAESLTRDGIPYRPFDRWSDVARALLDGAGQQ
jgi:2-hydroxy-3-keto-5-methylthiopentenyl-1-phosphate phosphatase